MAAKELIIKPSRSGRGRTTRRPSTPVRQGLQILVRAVKLAEDHGLKLISALANNWAHYGGMDMCAVNPGGKNPNDVYSFPTTIAAFKEPHQRPWSKFVT